MKFDLERIFSASTKQKLDDHAAAPKVVKFDLGRGLFSADYNSKSGVQHPTPQEAMQSPSEKESMESFTMTISSENSISKSCNNLCLDFLDQNDILRDCSNNFVVTKTESCEQESTTDGMDECHTKENKFLVGHLDEKYEEVLPTYELGHVLDPKTFCVQLDGDEQVQWLSSFQPKDKLKGNLSELMIDCSCCNLVHNKKICDENRIYLLKYIGPSFVQCCGDHGYVKEQHLMQHAFSIDDQTSSMKTDGVPMTASHLLLEKPLLLDRQDIHNGHDRCLFQGEEQYVKLLSMIPIHTMAANMQTKFSESENEKRNMRDMHQFLRECHKPNLRRKRENESHKIVTTHTKFEVMEVRDTLKVVLGLLSECALYLNNKLTLLPSVVCDVFQHFNDLSSMEIHANLSPPCCDRHHGGLFLDVVLPIRCHCHTNRKATRKFQQRPRELIDKGYNSEILHSCDVPITPFVMQDGMSSIYPFHVTINNIIMHNCSHIISEFCAIHVDDC